MRVIVGKFKDPFWYRDYNKYNRCESPVCASLGTGIGHLADYGEDFELIEIPDQEVDDGILLNPYVSQWQWRK